MSYYKDLFSHLLAPHDLSAPYQPCFLSQCPRSCWIFTIFVALYLYDNCGQQSRTKDCPFLINAWKENTHTQTHTYKCAAKLWLKSLLSLFELSMQTSKWRQYQVRGKPGCTPSALSSDIKTAATNPLRACNPTQQLLQGFGLMRQAFLLIHKHTVKKKSKRNMSWSCSVRKKRQDKDVNTVSMKTLSTTEKKPVGLWFIYAWMWIYMQ